MAGHINRIPATKPQGQWITKTKSSPIIDTRTFHHIVGTTFLFPLPERKWDRGGVPKRNSTFFCPADHRRYRLSEGLTDPIESTGRSHQKRTGRPRRKSGQVTSEKKTASGRSSGRPQCDDRHRPGNPATGFINKNNNNMPSSYSICLCRREERPTPSNPDRPEAGEDKKKGNLQPCSQES